MLFFVLGGLALLAFLGGLRAFERASVRTIKSLVAWIAALAGLSLVLLLVLTGREGVAIGALTLLGPLIWERWRAAHAASSGASASANSRRMPGNSGPMSRAEAYEILGLKPGANEAAIREAHRRLMRAAHPDGGGSDWVAARINAARDVLLGSRT